MMSDVQEALVGNSGRTVLVLMGGESSEHDISLRSGAAVVTNLAVANWVPVPVVIGRDGRYAFPPVDSLDTTGGFVDLGAAVSRMAALAPACVFPALHGLYGEDGRVQALCDLMHLPYVGSDVIGSAVAMDKWLAKAAYRAHKIPTADAVLLDHEELARPGWEEPVIERLGLPCVVKAPRQGSSVGVRIVHDLAALSQAAVLAASLGNRVMFEAFARGRELSVPVLEDAKTGAPRALPPIEIVVKTREFFDYDAKYDAKATDEICPAPIPDDLADIVSRLAVLAHKALMLCGFSRTDFIAAADGTVTVLETNTIPGLTEVSLFPKSAGVAGIPFSGLLDLLVRRAIAAGRRA